VTVPAVTVTLDPSYPNPFRLSTTVGFRLPAPARVKLTVHDVAGRRVAVLLDETRGAGLHQVEWNGRNDAGEKVHSGIYFYRLDAGKRIQVRKVVLVR
jgi:flagellar hook assembly protein FlgD